MRIEKIGNVVASAFAFGIVRSKFWLDEAWVSVRSETKMIMISKKMAAGALLGFNRGSSFSFFHCLSIYQYP